MGLRATQNNILAAWQMDRDRFNAWRAQNDLTQLLAFFKRTLPNFETWQNEFSITDSLFLAVERPSRFFEGQRDSFLRLGTTGDDTAPFVRKVHYISDLPNGDFYKVKRLTKHPYKILWEKKFTPYFLWHHRKTGSPYFSVQLRNQKRFYKSFVYDCWSHAGGHKYSRAELWCSFPVLKLGGVKIPANLLNDRNLDFVDLDGLNVYGRGTGAVVSTAYSSCHNLVFNNCDKAFLEFDNCNFEELHILNSRIQDLHITQDGSDNRNHAPRITAKESNMFRFSFSGCVPYSHFENCSVSDYALLKLNSNHYPAASNFYRAIRVAHQNRGQRKETANAFYLERTYEMLGTLLPLFPWGGGGYRFPGYYGKVLDLWWRYKSGENEARKSVRFISSMIFRPFKMLLFPNYLIRLLKQKIPFIWQFLDYATWGYGERPWRVVGWSLFIILLFSACFYFSEPTLYNGNIQNSFFCSAKAFLTVGCEGLEKNPELSPTVAIEGFLGVILVSMLVAGLSHKSRY